MPTTVAATQAIRSTAPEAAVDGGTGSSWREIVALARLAAFLRVDGNEIVGRESTIALLGFIALTAWIVVDPLVHTRELVFSWHAIPDLICIIAGVFTLAWLLQRLPRPALRFRRALVLTLSALPLAMLGTVASWKLTDPWLHTLIGLLSVYALLYFARGLRAMTGGFQPMTVLAGAAVTAVFLISLDFLQANPRLWIRADESLDRANTMGSDWARMVRVQFAQQGRIDADVAKLAPQTPGTVDNFFLGFAGYGGEQVFAREIALATRVMGERFDTASRSLRLVNDRRDLDTWPIATQPGLRHALLELGKVMGDEDVLFLALSSHGDRNAGLRISNAGMVPEKLGAQSLASMLDDAGIGWRVIVVSACYSGSFVDALANERSIVIAAAAPDRMSFGCNDSRQLTYFGEAFYRDALRDGVSMRAAFETARDALQRKERAAGITPSLPRASFGKLIEARLQSAREKSGPTPDR